MHLRWVLLFGIICLKFLSFVKHKNSSVVLISLCLQDVVCNFFIKNTLPKLFLYFKTRKIVLNSTAAFNCFYLIFRKQEFSGVKSPVLGYFWPFLVIFTRRGFFLKTLALSHTTLQESLVPCQISEKKNM